MKRGKEMKNWVVIASLMILGVVMSACTGGSRAWKEEVQLSDGRVVVIDREMISESGGDEWASNRSMTKPKEYRLRFASPDGSGKLIEWRSTKTDFQTWPEIPLVFDVNPGQPIVYSLVAISAGCEVYSKYVYQHGSWIEEPLSEHFDSLPTNLLFGSQKDLPPLLKLEDKRNRNNKGGYRRALKQIGPDRKVCG